MYSGLSMCVISFVGNCIGVSAKLKTQRSVKQEVFSWKHETRNAFFQRNEQAEEIKFYGNMKNAIKMPLRTIIF